MKQTIADLCARIARLQAMLVKARPGSKGFTGILAELKEQDDRLNELKNAKPQAPQGVELAGK